MRQYTVKEAEQSVKLWSFRLARIVTWMAHQLHVRQSYITHQFISHSSGERHDLISRGEWTDCLQRAGSNPAWDTNYLPL